MAHFDNLKDSLKNFKNFDGDYFEKMSKDNEDYCSLIDELSTSHHIEMVFASATAIEKLLIKAKSKNVNELESANLVIISEFDGFDRKPLDTMLIYEESDDESKNLYIRSFEFDVYKLFLFLKDANPKNLGFDVASETPIEIPLNAELFKKVYFDKLLSEKCKTILEKNLLDLDLESNISSNRKNKVKL